ncbi:MAG: hypothetical protein WED07_15700 [Candidatus Freyarchaeum deiterrae]
MTFMSNNFSGTPALSELIVNIVETTGKTEWEKRKFIRYLIDDLKKYYQISD